MTDRVDLAPPQRCAIYVRVSLADLNLENQLVHLRRFAEARGFYVYKEYADIASGAKCSRPQLDQMLKDARAGKFAVICVAALDRLARNVLHLLTMMADLKEHQVSVISLREQLDFTTPIGHASLAVISSISQLERDLISDRTKAAIAAKKLAAEKSGVPWRNGRPPLNQDLIDKVIVLGKEGLSLRTIEKALDRKVSRASIGRILKEWRAQHQIGSEQRLQKEHKE